MEKIFSEIDLQQIVKRGNSLEKIMQQLHYFKNGIPTINLLKIASINDGIFQFSEQEIKEFCAYFDTYKDNYSIEKFVPASGAATRMFKSLNEFLTKFDPEKDTINSYVNLNKERDLSLFIVGLRSFPFYDELKEKTKKTFTDYANYNSDQKIYAIVKTLLTEKGLNFTNKPKGILPFHYRNDEILTPIDEHAFETDFYKKPNQKAKIHFTISKEFQNDFLKITNKYKDLEITFSYQTETSDTIAVNADNTPFRTPENELFFRPGGHGALIENLNQLQSDIVFIRNIDNVSQNNREVILTHKKLLGGILLHTKKEVDAALKKFQKNEMNEKNFKEIINFIETKMSFPLPDEFKMYEFDYQKEYLIKILNRPIRVCGMVKNEGEPGGGPFWVQDEKGRCNLQIVELSQIDSTNENQLAVFKNSTHFNPVDIVCSIKDFEGNKFDLNKFVNPKTAFITEKTKNGKEIKAFELPGLWNGAMAKWTTIFVEVPIETFNPVKKVNDLLKPAHQPNNLDSNSVL
ncbi:DUF4301 family protein [Flavobacterium sp.]|jgi:hypothetical protein|uniref:DUF4301 family protein n=1 Tax=Flavobacterium sp. TaxID=239 RepID=UPI0037C023B5